MLNDSLSHVAYCKIFPPIGIARLGDSPTDYYMGAETVAEENRDENFTFRDSEGRIKRQAARFRIYAFDKHDNFLGELTHETATIEWRCRVANKKAAWFRFLGAQAALDSITGDRDVDNPSESRNSTIGKLTPCDGPIGRKYASDEVRADHLEIQPEEVCISGPLKKSNPDDPSRQYRFSSKFKRVRDVYLGEALTDECGRLLVLGGHGISDAVDNNGTSIRADRWILNYANNDDWYDDVCDGYVHARVTLRDESKRDKKKKAIEVKGGAWIIVAAPRFAPDTKNLVTAFDVMEEVLHDNPTLQSPEMPQPASPDKVVYDRDIKPILQRAMDYAWLNERALRGHGFNKPGDWRRQISDDLANPDPDNLPGKSLRERIFRLLRTPIYSRPRSLKKMLESDVPIEVRRRQANFNYMPPLSGDQGDTTIGDPTTWLTLTHLQYERFRSWSKGDFARTSPSDSETESDTKATFPPPSPYELTRTTLEACVGGAFFPGIEMTSIIRHPSLYREAYRFDDELLEPGDITKHMALPWQADFYECQQNWWPGARPDDILTDEDFDEIFKNFEEETVGDPRMFESVIFNRRRWDRGLDSMRPSSSFLRRRFLPDPVRNQSTADYVAGRVKDGVGMLLRQTVAGDYGSLDAIEQSVRFNERLPSLHRVQFLVQDALDQFSGRFFHLTVPRPNDLYHSEDNSRSNKESNYSPPETSSSWATDRVIEDAGRSALVDYMGVIRTEIERQVEQVFNEHPERPADLASFHAAMESEILDGVGEPVDNFTENDSIFKRLRFFEYATMMIDLLYRRHSNQSGDEGMVDGWRDLGFVVRKTKKVRTRDGNDESISVIVETERHRYAGLSFREYFYYMMNTPQFPDIVPYARVLADQFLKEAEGFIDEIGITDELHPESFVPYSEANFDAKTQQIYENLRADANSYSANRPWWRDRNRAERALLIVSNAAFNQTDGSWLRNISRAGTSNEMRGLLFDIWSDEIGNGDPLLHHGNLYTALMRQLGYVLPEVNSRSYAFHPNLSEQLIVGAVLPLVISEHTDDYFPEILGMTLFLEWEVLSLVRVVKELDYLGIDSHFYRMHVAIDNATEGHGYEAKRAVKLYLDQVLADSGPNAVHSQWRRIWRGFVAFALGGGAYFNNGVQSDDRVMRRYPGSPKDQIERLVQRKKPYGNLQHGNKQLGGFRINDLFDAPTVFMEELANSRWITAGRPELSPFLSFLTEFEGKMYKVFDRADLELWRDWIVWLGKTGDTPTTKRYLDKGEAMLMLLSELREIAMSEPSHRRYRLALTEDVTAGSELKSLSVAQLFAEPDLKKLMKALADKDNGWVEPGDPNQSPLVVDLLKGNNRMGRVLDQRFAAIHNQIGRLIIVRWIAAGCPIPGEPAPTAKPMDANPMKIRKLIVQQYGMGAVH